MENESELKLDPGEQLQILKKLIYQNAKVELVQAQTSPSVQVLIMEGVIGMFLKDAYEEKMLSGFQSPKETIEQTDTKEEFLKEMDKKGLVKK